MDYVFDHRQGLKGNDAADMQIMNWCGAVRCGFETLGKAKLYARIPSSIV